MLSLDSGSMDLIFLQEPNTGHRSQVVCHKMLCVASPLGKDWWSELIILFLRGKISKPLKLLFKGNLWLPNSKLVTTVLIPQQLRSNMSSDSFPRNYFDGYQRSLMLLIKFTWGQLGWQACKRTLSKSCANLYTAPNNKEAYFFITVIKLKFQNFFCLHWP